MYLRYVFAFGGNAFDRRNLRIAAKAILSLYKNGNQIVITHGNGPQVGELYLQEGKNLAILTGQTQAELGVEIEKEFSSEESMRNRVAIVLTRTLVNKNDPEFRNPSKPIGKYYKNSASVPVGDRDFIVKKLLKGYRLVVPSPAPRRILETDEIQNLLKKKFIVIAAGGGGIAVTRSKKGFEFADGVIDKDLASALLAAEIKADRLFILTDVDGAYLDYTTKKQKLIKRVKAGEIKRYLRSGHFEEGSMKPKVEAGIEFVMRTHKIAAIGNMSKINEVIALRSTVVTT